MLCFVFLQKQRLITHETSIQIVDNFKLKTETSKGTKILLGGVGSIIAGTENLMELVQTTLQMMISAAASFLLFNSK